MKVAINNKKNKTEKLVSSLNLQNIITDTICSDFSVNQDLIENRLYPQKTVIHNWKGNI